MTHIDGSVVNDVEKPNCICADAGFTLALTPIAPTPCVKLPVGARFHVILVTKPLTCMVSAVTGTEGGPDPVAVEAITSKS